MKLCNYGSFGEKMARNVARYRVLKGGRPAIYIGISFLLSMYDMCIIVMVKRIGANGMTQAGHLASPVRLVRDLLTAGV